MPRSNILVVVVDGLRASALGAYGNTTYPTPALDQFAADSFVFDWCYSPSADLAGIYRALWQSSHPARPLEGISQKGDRTARLSLPRRMADGGYQITLVTDEPQLVSFADVADFNECVQLATPPEISPRSSRAANATQTELASMFSAAGELVARRDSAPKLVWAHARGMYGPWDAPLALQGSLLDEGDPPAVESVVPPDFAVSAGDDPEEAYRYSCAFAAQAMVFDECWHSLEEALATADSDNAWLVMLIGARGYSLGEHGRVGGVDSRLYTEQLHVPWLIRYPDARGQLARSGNLVSHLDVAPTLLEWIDGGANLDNSCCDGLSTVPLATTVASPWRDALLSASTTGKYALRTSAWSLLGDSRDMSAPNDTDAAPEKSSPSPAELYVRPDDRWEANDIAKLCGEVVDDLQEAASNAIGRLSRDEPVPSTLFHSETGAIPV